MYSVHKSFTFPCEENNILFKPRMGTCLKALDFWCYYETSNWSYNFSYHQSVCAIGLCLWALFDSLRGHSTTTWTEFCHLLTSHPPFVDSFYTLSVDKNIYFLTPSTHHLVHVVIEWFLRKTSTYLCMT
jgi:hypothetical protein